MSRRDDEIDDELRAHLNMAIRDRIERGEDPGEAAAAARREFGNQLRISEDTREVWAWTWLESVVQDLRYAARGLRKSAGFTAVAVLSLALGIGANTAIFTILNAVVLKMLPVSAPHELVEILQQYPGEPRGNGYWSGESYEHFRSSNHVFASLAGFARDNRAEVSIDGEPFVFMANDHVTPNFFAMLGLPVALAEGGAIISGKLHQRYPHLIGKQIQIDGKAVTVSGVAPEGFVGMLTGSPTDVWTLRAAEAKSRVAIFGRLARHATINQARAEIQTLAEFTREELMRTSKDPQWKHMKFFVEFAGNGNNMIRDKYGKPITVIMGITGVLLLIACVNLAGMLLARAASRQREMAIRAGLGASRGRLIRQVMTESLLLSAIGAVLAIGVAFGATRVLSAIIASGRPHERVVLDLAPDLDSLLFTIVVSILTGLLFGLAPAFAGTKPARRTRRLSDALVAAQIAAAVVLLTAAALATGYLSDLRNLNLGFNRHNVLLFQVDGSKGFDKARAVELLRRFEAIPGVQAASISAVSPIQGAGASRMVNADGFVERAEDRRYSSLNWVTPRYFEALGIPFLEGRDFRFDDEGKPHYAIISRAMAQHYFKGRSAIGGMLQFDGRTTRYEVIGVAGDSKYLDLKAAPPRTMYMNTLQTPNPVSQYVVRTAVAPESVANEARRIAAEVAPWARVDRVTTLAEQVDSSIVRERLVAQLANLFGVLGALIAAIGLYGLLAYPVTRRTSEIGLRMALGATPANVLALVLKHALALTLTGVAIGAGLASQAPGLPASATTPAVIGAAVMIAIALVAAYVPARRAARIEPLRALRCE